MQAGENAVIEVPENETLSDTFCVKDKWIHLQDPTDKEIEFVIAKSGAPEEFLKSALDEEERARIESDDGFTLVLVDVPFTQEDDGYYTYTTMPLAIITGGDTIITVCLRESVVVSDFVYGRVKELSLVKRSWFTLKMLYTVATKFLQNLRQIDKASQRLQNELHRSMKNQELTRLLELENSLVYFSTSLQANEAVINKIIRSDVLKKYEEDKELLEDVQIENQQAIEMCSIYRNILSGTMDAFSSIISNNLNVAMRLLTAITFLLSIPTLIASLFGMNVGVPWQNDIRGFWIVLGICLLCSTIAGIIVFRRPNARIKKDKKDKKYGKRKRRD